MKIEKTIIDDFEVKVVKLPVRKRIALKVKIVNILGNSLKELLAIVEKYKDGENINVMQLPVSDIAGVIKEIVVNIDDETFLKLIDTLGESVFVNDRPLNEDEVLENVFDNGFTLYKIIAFALKIQFESFFLKINTIMKDLAEQGATMK